MRRIIGKYYTDIQEALEAIVTYKQFDKEALQQIKIKKAEERGCEPGDKYTVKSVTQYLMPGEQF